MNDTLACKSWQDVPCITRKEKKSMSLRTSQPITIHQHTSGEQGLFVNAYLIETPNGVVAVDGTLTRSESRAFRLLFETLNKPLLAVLVTHAHPDHVAGITELVQGKDIPIIAPLAVKLLMEQTEQAKHAQWGPIYQEEWIRSWSYPNHLVKHLDTITFDGISYRVYDLGPGGDCDANAIWVAETEPQIAFVGDLIFNDMHSYVADDHLLGWLANLERARAFLQGVETVYLEHGKSGSLDLLDAQRDYLLTYCVAVKELSQGEDTLTETAKQALITRMQQYAPDARLTFMIALGADAVAAELARRK
jgi:glyoxylase-like metal-dependent hydrolase (beta-lactamase superfamily II)